MRIFSERNSSYGTYGDETRQKPGSRHFEFDPRKGKLTCDGSGYQTDIAQRSGGFEIRTAAAACRNRIAVNFDLGDFGKNKQPGWRHLLSMRE